MYFFSFYNLSRLLFTPIIFNIISNRITISQSFCNLNSKWSTSWSQISRYYIHVIFLHNELFILMYCISYIVLYSHNLKDSIKKIRVISRPCYFHYPSQSHAFIKYLKDVHTPVLNMCIFLYLEVRVSITLIR